MTFNTIDPESFRKLLRSAGLLDSERRGTWVYYWVIPSALQQLSSVLDVETNP